MRIFLAILVGVLTSTAATAYDNPYVQQKRAAAEQQKMQTLQTIQHKQTNPIAFMNKIEEEKSISFRVSGNGHYYVPATVNGRTISFIADTGASSIFLTQDDARKLGLNVDNLNYSKIYNTANGQVRAAGTIIPAFKVGPIEMMNVPVSVSSVKSGQSLLGMTFFSKLKSYNVQNNIMTLYK